jgi:hypothetical protein
MNDLTLPVVGRVCRWSEAGRRIPWLIDWLALKQATDTLTGEVQNSNPDTPADRRRVFTLAALTASIEYLIGQEIQL